MAHFMDVPTILNVDSLQNSVGSQSSRPVLPRQTRRQVLSSCQRAAGGGGVAFPPQTALHVPFRLSGVTKSVCRRHTFPRRILHSPMHPPFRSRRQEGTESQPLTSNTAGKRPPSRGRWPSCRHTPSCGGTPRTPSPHRTP